MALLKYTFWQDEEMWLGYLEEYPDYMTQGEKPWKNFRIILEIFITNLSAALFLPYVLPIWLLHEKTRTSIETGEDGLYPAAARGKHDWYHNPITKLSQPCSTGVSKKMK